MVRKTVGLGIYKVLLPFLVILFGLVLMGGRNYLASLSLTPATSGDMRIVKESVGKNIIRYKVEFKTGSDDPTEGVSTISFRLKIIDKDLNEINITDEKGAVVDKISPNLELESTDNWQFPVNRVEREDGNLFIDLAAVYKDKTGFVSSDYVSIAEFYLTGSELKDPRLEFDEAYSEMYSKRRPVTDVWGN